MHREWLYGAVLLVALALVLILYRLRKSAVNSDQLIVDATRYSVRLEHLLVGKAHTVKSDRDDYTLRFWTIIFEHHQGLLLLLRTKHFAPAFALMRPVVECFCRMFVYITGTDGQRDAIREGTYNTEFTKTMDDLDKMLGVQAMFGPFFKREMVDTLHGFTHGGVEQLMRRFSGNDIIANYSDDEIMDCVRFTTLFTFLAALMALDFLGYPAEFQAACQMFNDYLRPQTSR